MDESTKTRKLWNAQETAILSGKGIDIGCGPDPVTESVRRFDVGDGDANEITKYVHDTFDFVYASHCLEHMHRPREAVLEWWKLVRPGGHLFFLVPDEDLYEQGVFPSRFNPDHKATFTLSKSHSWSPVSINVLELALSLPAGRLVSLKLQDEYYDRRLYRHGVGLVPAMPVSTRRLLRVYNGLKRRLGVVWPPFETLQSVYSTMDTVDQTLRPDAVAQIQCIVQKVT